MVEKKRSASETWLEAKAPGFCDLPSADRGAIVDFTFLWSLFEAEIMLANARIDRIIDVVDSWANNGSLDAEAFDDELSYFRDRYFADGDLTHHYPHLGLRKSDHQELVEAVIKGVRNDPRDRMLTLLIIVWRLRNNLFHGEKWAYQIRDQYENFNHANSILMRVLERHSRLT